MSEEVFNASTIVPYTLLASVTLSGCLGFAMLIAILFCLGNPAVTLNTSTGYPFISAFLQATSSTAGTMLIVAIIILLGTISTISGLAAASRMIWSFANDHGLPASRFLSQVRLTPHSLPSLLSLLTQHCSSSSPTPPFLMFPSP